MKLAHNIKQNKVFAVIPRAKEFKHEGMVVLPQTLNSVFGTKRKYHVELMHTDPKVVEPRGLGHNVFLVVIAPVQDAAVKAYLNKEVVVCHRQGIAVRLAIETPIAVGE